jgi:hypothetical protein
MSTHHYWLGADQEQGALAIDSIAGFLARTPRLAGRVEVQSRRVLVPSTGASLDVLAADAAGAWGLRPAGVFVDELTQWTDTPQPRRLWEAVSSAVAKQSGAATIRDASGPSPRDVLAELRIESGERWIDAATDWQHADALAVIEGEAPYHFLTRARGGSKTSDLAAVALALLLAGSRRPGALLVVLTTAGDPAHFSRAILDHACGSPLWRVNEVPGPPPWADVERLAEQRGRLSESMYARLFENRWVAAEDRLTSPEQLAACVVLDGPQPSRPRRTYAIGLDVGLKRDRTAAIVCHAEPLERDSEAGARIVLDRAAVWKGSRLRPVRLAEVEEWLAEASRHYRGAEIVLDPWQAVGLAQRLRDRGIKVTEFNFSAQSTGRLGSTLHLLIREGALALPDDRELLDELAHVRLRETSPGVLRLDHDASRHDDQAVALALAAQHLLRERKPGPPAISPVNPWKHAGRKRNRPSPKVWVSGRGTAANPRPGTTRAPGTPAQVRARTLSRKRNQSRGGRT